MLPTNTNIRVVFVSQGDITLHADSGDLLHRTDMQAFSQGPKTLQTFSRPTRQSLRILQASRVEAFVSIRLEHELHAVRFSQGQQAGRAIMDCRAVCAMVTVVSISRRVRVTGLVQCL